MKLIISFTLYAVLIAATFVITCRVFDSYFAEITIDWFAFLSGIFLIAEGLYRIVSSKERQLSLTILRSIRVVIGTCVFTIHLLQFMRF